MGLANETDALVRIAVERRRALDGYTLIEVPERRDFHFGNALVIASEPKPAEYGTWLARHAEHFAGTGVHRHVAVWEVEGERAATPDLEPELTLQRSTVFVRRRPFESGAGALPIREFADSAAWDAAEAIFLAEVEPDDPPERADFERWMFGTLRRAGHVGRLRMWGCWEGDALVAFAGTYGGPTRSRFATPVTRPAYRGRGLFRALAATAVNATLAAYPAAPVVICATTDAAPARIYRRLGFTAVGEQYGLLAPVAD